MLYLTDTVKKYNGKYKKNGETLIKERTTNKRYWKCICNCGNETEVDYYHLINGNTKSCGCLHKRKGKNSPFFRGCGELPLDVFSVAKRNAAGGGKFNRKPKEFTITIEQAWEQFLKQNRRCALTGLELSFGEGPQREQKYSKTSTKTASLDRIDSTKGYVVGNIQWVHKNVNIMKNDLDSETFFYYCSLIHENRTRKNRSDTVYDAPPCAS